MYKSGSGFELFINCFDANCSEVSRLLLRPTPLSPQLLFGSVAMGQRNVNKDCGDWKAFAIDLVESHMFIPALNAFNRNHILTDEVIVYIVVVEDYEPEQR